MKKRICAVLLALGLALSLTACGSSALKSSGASKRSADMTAAADNGGDGYYYAAEAAEDAEYETEPNAEGDSTGESGQSAYQKAKVKLIRRASVRLETREFDAAVSGLEALVDSLGGYVEDSSVDQGGYGSTYRSASYTVRVPSEKYDDFLDRVSADEHCHLVSKNESTEDVGQAYFDTESRLRTLRTKLDRLQELLAQAKHMDDIITLEEAISNTEYEIDSYTSTLNRYDSLVGYSTFTVTINQVVTISDTDTIPFHQRLGNSFVGGLKDFAEGFGEFLIWLVGHVMNLVLLVLFILLIRFLLRRSKEKKAKRLAEMQEKGLVPPQKTGWKHPLKGKDSARSAEEGNTLKTTPGPISGKQVSEAAAQAAPKPEEPKAEASETEKANPADAEKSKDSQG